MKDVTEVWTAPTLLQSDVLKGLKDPFTVECMFVTSLVVELDVFLIAAELPLTADVLLLTGFD